MIFHFSFSVILKITKHISDQNLFRRAHCKPVIEELINSRATDSALLDDTIPPILGVLEVRQVLIMEFFFIGSRNLSLVRYPVLDKIGLRERCSARIQRLEYQLGIDMIVQFDNDNLKKFRQRFKECLILFFNHILISCKPLLNFLREISMGIKYPNILIRRKIMTPFHDLLEDFLIPTGRPDFKLILLGLRNRRVVFRTVSHQFPKHHLLSPLALAVFIIGCIKQKLKSREPLLTIDHPTSRNNAMNMTFQLQNDRTQEVSRTVTNLDFLFPVTRCIKVAFDKAADILPERLPLVIQTPDVATLVRWHHVAPRGAKKVIRGLDSRRDHHRRAMLGPVHTQRQAWNR